MLTPTENSCFLLVAISLSATAVTFNEMRLVMPGQAACLDNLFSA